MDDDRFDRFLSLLLSDMERAGWLTSRPAATYEGLDAPIQPTLQIGLATRASRAAPPTGQQQHDLDDIQRILDYTITAGGTRWIEQEAPRDALLAQANREAVRDRALGIIEETPAYGSGLRDFLADSANRDLIVPGFLTLLHGPRWAALLSRLHSLIAWLENALAVKVLASERCREPDRPRQEACRGELRRLSDLFPKIRKALRRAARTEGRLGTLPAALEGLAEDTRHHEDTHRAMVERQLTALTERREEWQRRRLGAELVLYDRLQELLLRRRDLDKAIAEDWREFRQLQRRGRDRNRLSAELEEQKQELGEKKKERELLMGEIKDLTEALGEEGIRRARQYRDAVRRGIRPADETPARDDMLRELDGRIGALTQRRLLVADDSASWIHYDQLLDLLLKNTFRLSIELFMNSFLFVCQYVERDRAVGLDANRRGKVQWLTYPGHHGDSPVDWNCDAGLPLTMEMPEEFILPARYRTSPADAAPYLYQGTKVSERTHGSNDLQDIFGKLAVGLLGSAGAKEEPLARLFRDHGDEELPPANVLPRRRTPKEISSLLLGLLARNLTPIDNARAFDEERRQLVLHLERAVADLRGLPPKTKLFNRSRVHANSGAFGIRRIIIRENITPADLYASVQDLLLNADPRHWLPGPIWNLLIRMRSAGAETHRRAASVTVQHTYRRGAGAGSSGPRGSEAAESGEACASGALTVEVYYTHMYEISVRPSDAPSRGDKLGLTGSTGSAVNSHVHIEIRIVRDGRVIGSCLPHEFFALRAP